MSWEVAGQTYDWPAVVEAIRSGRWTLADAARNLCMPASSIMMRLGLTAKDLTLSAAARAAAAEAMQAAGGTAASSAGGALGGAVIAFFTKIGSWLGLSGGAGVAAGILVTTAVLGGVTYVGSRALGELAADRPSARLGPTAVRTGRDCPPRLMHKTMCPWGPQAPGYFVAECGPGFCFDGGGHGTGSCKQTHAAPGARRTYLRDLECPAGTAAVIDECTGVLLECAPR